MRYVNPAAEETRSLFIGQSFDLYWTFNLACPSVNEYLEMIDKSKSTLEIEGGMV